MVFLRKTFRTIMGNKVQFLGALLMILISSMQLVGMTTVASNLAATFDSFAAGHMLADAEFNTTSPIDEARLESQFNAVIEASSVADYELSPGQTLRIFAETEAVNRYALLDGQALAQGSILIDPFFARANQLEIGDALEIAGVDYQIAGFMALPDYIYILQSKEEMINDPSAFGIAVLSQGDFQGMPAKSDFYVVRFTSRENIQQQELRLKGQLLSDGVQVTRWDSTDKNNKVSYVELEVTTLTIMSRVLPGTLLILSMILIGIVLKRMIQREAPVIGTLYALGYRKGELLRHYLGYPLLIAGAGGVVGALLGVGMVDPMLGFFMTVFSMPVEGYHYNYSLVLIGILLPLGVLCLVSYLVIRRLLRLSPAELMKGSHTSGKRNLIERSLRLERFSFSTKFQIREQVRSLSRTGFLLLGIIVATSLLLYGLTLQSSLDYMLNKGIAELYNLKYEYVFHEMRLEAPPAGFEPFNAVYVTPQADPALNFAVVGTLPESTRIRLRNLSGEKLIPDQVIITTMLADKLKVKAGDSLHLTSAENLRQYFLTIDAVADSAAGEFIFMPLDGFNEMLGVAAGSYIGIWGDEPLTFPEGILKSTKSIDVIVEGIRTLINQTGVMVYFLSLAAFFLGLIIIFLVTGMLVEENRNTISLFKVLGYRPKEVNKLILDSNLFVVILGYLIGIPVLLASITALMQALTESMQMTIPAHMNGWNLLLGFVVILITYQSAKWLSKRKVDQVPMSEALKAGTE